MRAFYKGTNPDCSASYKSLRDYSGFSSIELLVVVSIIIFLAAMAIPFYGNFYGSSQFNERTAEIIQTLRTAQGRSMARANNKSHGVFFNIDPSGPDRFVLYQGASYLSRDIDYDRTVTLEDFLSLSTNLSGNEINFSLGLGAPMPATGGQVILANALGESVVIAINPLGTVSD